MKILMITILTFIFCNINAQSIDNNFNNFKKNQFNNSLNENIYVTKEPGHFTCEQWRHKIDSVWGTGASTTTKLQVFDRFWNLIDTVFACFHNHPVSWDSLKKVYRPEIAGGVSRGRFIAIMNHIVLALKESHTHVLDFGLNTTLRAGVPLLVLGGWYDNGHFGAGLTPLPDSSLLVYSVVPLHPLGLQKGDIVLGYDGVPWRILVRELIECELPIKLISWIGSSPSAYNHSLLMSAGMNWHLFDTIDIVKGATGDTLHFSTAALRNQNMQIFCTEQMDIPGISKPNYNAEQMCTYGILPGTNIGYIYVWGWWGPNVEMEFYNAVQALMQTQGMIIDFRFNDGGNMNLSDAGLSLLFDTTVTTIDMGKRCSPNHQQMCPLNIPFAYYIPGASPGYNKPIAILTGPGAVSSGDQVALRMKYHPHSRFFGKSTAAAFNAPFEYGYSGYGLLLAEADAYKLSNPGTYLTHTEFEVDENVWLSQNLVRQGRDDVYEAAKHWIDSVSVGISVQNSEMPLKFSLKQNYPNPFNPTTKIKFEIPSLNIGANLNIKLAIYDLLGREVSVLVNEKLEAGIYEYSWDGGSFSSGLYFYKLESDNFTETKKMLLLK
ncbi:MAG TPA: S41 family peptidase [Ignavibacteria bacterium]|nr:S41 family peptidase [Ignavibacteria bacterium]